MQPLVSIVINNFNYGRYLRFAIESALLQEECSTEVIVVDDGSTDDSHQVIESFGSQVRSIFKENGGQASAINVGVAAAAGDYILLLDSDDVLDRRAVAMALARFEPGYSRVAWQLQKVDENGAALPTSSKNRLSSGLDGDAINYYMRTNKFPMTPTSGNLFRGSDLRAVLPVPEKEFRISADVYILIATAERGKVRVLNSVLTAYRIHGNNNFHSGGNYFDPKIIESHLRGEINTRVLLQAAARRRVSSFEAPPITARMTTALKVVLAKRMGLMPGELSQWTFTRVLGTYWSVSGGRASKLLGVTALIACATLPLWALRAMTRARRGVHGSQAV